MTGPKHRGFQSTHAVKITKDTQKAVQNDRESGCNLELVRLRNPR